MSERAPSGPPPEVYFFTLGPCFVNRFLINMVVPLSQARRITALVGLGGDSAQPLHSGQPRSGRFQISANG